MHPPGAQSNGEAAGHHGEFGDGFDGGIDHLQAAHAWPETVSDHSDIAGDEGAYEIGPRKKVRAHRPDVAVVDIRLPPTNTDDGLRAAVTLRTENPDLGILILSQYVEETYARELLEPGAEGVGYLLKDRVGDIDRFIDAVRRVADRGSVLDPEVVTLLLGRHHTSTPLGTLTDREHTVVAHMAEGLSNIAIGRALHVSEASVEKHIRSIFAKLNLPTDPHTHRRVLTVLTYLHRPAPE